MNCRWLNKIYAHFFGYFWIPCQLCQREYGGHEWRDYNGLSSVYNGFGICPQCTKEGRGDPIVIRIVNEDGSETFFEMIPGGYND